ncbi:unnamed protein product [Aureobasidium uvarum]|uniref:F-box domain-containing protein n=1 Tax=Aureobasidium uvarum TaxID=2773716 RepID=A0A9N8PNR9_9PEZI|nr:unnamed protein product [Aureobasidium uvarum]
MANYAAHIVALPPEILDIIVANCQDGDLSNLRLSCRTLSSPSTRPFGRRCLAHLRIIFTELSLQGLVDITAHPVFGTSVRSISFGTYRLTGLKYFKLSSVPGNHASDLIVKKRLAKKQQAFNRSGDQLVMLTTALQNLKLRGGPSIGLRIHDDSMRSKERRPIIRAHGYHRAYGKFLPEKHEVEKTLLTLIDASSLSGFMPAALDIDMTSDFQLLRNLLCNTTFKNFITTKEHSLDPQMDIYIKFDDSKTRFTCMFTRRTCLELEPLGSYYGNFYRALQRTAIVDLKIRDATYSSSLPHLVECLVSWKKTIRYLDLSRAVVFERQMTDFAATLFRYMRDDLELEVLKLHDIRIYPYNGSHRWLFNEPAKWHGKQEIREGLHRVISELNTDTVS